MKRRIFLVLFALLLSLLSISQAKAKIQYFADIKNITSTGDVQMKRVQLNTPEEINYASLFAKGIVPVKKNFRVSRLYRCVDGHCSLVRGLYSGRSPF